MKKIGIYISVFCTAISSDIIIAQAKVVNAYDEHYKTHESRYCDEGMTWSDYSSSGTNAFLTDLLFHSATLPFIYTLNRQEDKNINNDIRVVNDGGSVLCKNKGNTFYERGNELPVTMTLCVLDTTINRNVSLITSATLKCKNEP